MCVFVALMHAAIQSLAELFVSLQRIDAFLLLPEPPQHEQAQTCAEAGVDARASKDLDHPYFQETRLDAPAGQVAAPASVVANGTVILRGAGYDWNRPLGDAPESAEPARGTGSAKSAHANVDVTNGVVATPAKSAAQALPLSAPGNEVSTPVRARSKGVAATTPADQASSSSPDQPSSSPESESAVRAEVRVCMEGADAKSAAFHGTPTSTASSAAAEAETPTASATSQRSLLLSLSGVQLQLQPGELLGVCGEVGSGKSSLLAVLLGELRPVSCRACGKAGATAGASDDSTAAVDCEVHGKMAYCSQVS